MTGQRLYNIPKSNFMKNHLSVLKLLHAYNHTDSQNKTIEKAISKKWR
jgi:hypothetical protein